MRNKNAIRLHEVAPFISTDVIPTDDDFMALARWISDVDDSTDEEIDDTGFYDGDGTPETNVVGVSGAYGFSGFYDHTDEAQAFISNMKYKTGNGRRCWHRVTSADGSKQWLGWATVSDIVAGSGAATEYEAFGCTITYNQIPVETDLTATTPEP